MTAPAIADRTSAAGQHGLAEVDAPIVAAVDASTASRAAIREAVRLAAELAAPLVFVYVRRGPAGFFGAPVYQRRLTKEMARARRVLDDSLAAAREAGVPAEGEILEGSPRRRIADFVRDRAAHLVVVGSRRRRLGRSVSRGVVRAAERPVVVRSPAHNSRSRGRGASSRLAAMGSRKRNVRPPLHFESA